MLFIALQVYYIIKININKNLIKMTRLLLNSKFIYDDMMNYPILIWLMLDNLIFYKI